MIEHHVQDLVELGSLVMAEYNPRIMSSDMESALIGSLREFGFVQPIVARREDGLVIGGHQRLVAYRKILAEDGVAEPEKVKVPVVLLDGISDQKAKAMNLALNKIAGEWDYDKLSNVLADLQSADLDLSMLSGFSMDEIQDITGLMSQPAVPLPEIDVEEELARGARKFSFEVDSNEEAAACTAVLASFGMTGPGNAGAAFVAAMRAAGGIK